MNLLFRSEEAEIRMWRITNTKQHNADRFRFRHVPRMSPVWLEIDLPGGRSNLMHDRGVSIKYKETPACIWVLSSDSISSRNVSLCQTINNQTDTGWAHKKKKKALHRSNLPHWGTCLKPLPLQLTVFILLKPFEKCNGFANINSWESTFLILAVVSILANEQRKKEFKTKLHIMTEWMDQLCGC